MSHLREAWKAELTEQHRGETRVKMKGVAKNYAQVSGLVHLQGAQERTV